METTCFTPKNPFNFCCKNCHFTSCNKKDYTRHLLTNKHKNLTNPNIKTPENPFLCICGKSYKHSSSLSKHKKTCKVEVESISDSENGPSDKEIIMMLIKENSEFKNIMMKMLENGTHNHTNSHNKSFNLQFFLNETCKNAMNITDFVDSLQLQLSDLEKVGDIGYIEGISNIIIKNLNALDITDRPIHCTDKKRETIYIKDEDKWEESMGGAGDNDYDKEEKIIKKLVKEVFIDKSTNIFNV